jgi:hypothetical protein
MKVCVRIVAALALLLGVAGLLLSLAGGAGVWVVKEPVTSRATYVFGRIDAALDVADDGLAQVKASIDRAAERLENAKEEQRKLGPPQGVRRFLAQTVRQAVAPELGNAHEKLHTVAEAAVVVNSVLEDVGNFPFLAESGLDLGPLTEMNSQLVNVGPAAWELSRLLGDPAPDADADAQLSRVEQALKTMRGLIAEYEPRLTQFREKTELLKSKTLGWITPAAVVASSVCFWIALLHLLLLSNAWSWWRRAGQKNPRPGAASNAPPLRGADH